MGLLSCGTPIPWEQSLESIKHVKEQGIEQFIHWYKVHASRTNDPRLFGDEIEFMAVHESDFTLYTRADELIDELNREEGKVGTFIYEYASYMIECTPPQPYPEDLNISLRSILGSVTKRREIIKKHLPKGVIPLTLTAYPFLGLKEAMREKDLISPPEFSPTNYVPKDLICKHPRFKILTLNILKRRGSPLEILVPKNNHTDNIQMDAMVFGMGNCCLQITFQASCLEEAIALYDSLIPITPIMLAISAASPIYKGDMSDWDCRWNIVAGSVDDRNVKERMNISKGRFGSVSRYLSDEGQKFNDDPKCLIDATAHTRLIEAGIPKNLAAHIAHLYIRDPLAIYQELIHQDKEESTDHFDNIQSTNWQSLRFKPPTKEGKTGWRVEFRVMDVQFEDRDNARLIIFMAILVRSIVKNPKAWERFYMPITAVDQNFERAHEQKAVTTGKFWWNSQSEPGKLVEISAKEIFQMIYPLLTGVLCDDLDYEGQKVGVDALGFILNRLQGEEPTDALRIREFFADGKPITPDNFIQFLYQRMNGSNREIPSVI
jgi:glutamate--cysteine ligase catalytic subunit